LKGAKRAPRAAAVARRDRRFDGRFRGLPGSGALSQSGWERALDGEVRSRRLQDEPRAENAIGRGGEAAPSSHSSGAAGAEEAALLNKRAPLFPSNRRLLRLHPARRLEFSEPRESHKAPLARRLLVASRAAFAALSRS
jgi:hypothetical protein